MIESASRPSESVIEFGLPIVPVHIPLVRFAARDLLGDFDDLVIRKRIHARCLLHLSIWPMLIPPQHQSSNMIRASTIAKANIPAQRHWPALCCVNDLWIIAGRS